jgi:hypothetical protein
MNIKQKAREMFDEKFKELNGETEIWKGNKPPNHIEIKLFIDQIIDMAVEEERRKVLRDIEIIVVNTGCNYASAINRYMHTNEITEKDIVPTKTNK